MRDGRRAGGERHIDKREGEPKQAGDAAADDKIAFASHGKPPEPISKNYENKYFFMQKALGK